ncbi:hypothetical protein BC938DRAFT_477724 [Jimgerdemannia flammicorona]|uniref:FAD-binding PCMH-type domain-containing protein n=1 Tax=Jimgerdemannia flammicorona TaxID=994334 RepID=A0A433P810_9FUNG|nr:hypothetical protein BC938DRAFT_477724 [Jimgerdemannia flammicorona]
MPPPTNRLSAQLARPFLVHLRSRLPATVLPIAARARAFHASSTAGQTEAKEGTPKATTNIHKLTPLTSEKHPEIKRDPKFSQLTDADLAHFHTLLPPTSILYSASPPTIASSDLMPYNLDWFNLYRGTSQLVLFPRTTHDVSLILSYCHARSLAVVPQGGNTGVSGGAVPVFDEVIVNMSKMNNVRRFDEISGVVVADSGIILEKLDEFLTERDHIVPLDLGAKGSCQVGGNVSTNAGGLRLMRFGSLHGSVLGLEVVSIEWDVEWGRNLVL